MKTSSRKSKGRRLQNFVAERLQGFFGWSVEDCKPAVMGESGVDIKLGSREKAQFPYDIECKNVEKINIWQSLKQAEENTEEGRKPLLVFTRNRSPTYVVMRWEDFEESLL